MVWKLPHILLVPFLILVAQAQSSSRYRELKKVITANVGFAHESQGVNMYTLVALRGCVSAKDVGVLSQMLSDSDVIVKMASARVLVDLGSTGKAAVQQQIHKTPNVSDRSILGEAVKAVAEPTYRPILDYPLTKAERERIRGCSSKSR